MLSKNEPAGFNERPNIQLLQQDRDVRQLIHALKYKEDENIPGNAAQALGVIGDPAAVPALIEALYDDTHTLGIPRQKDWPKANTLLDFLQAANAARTNVSRDRFLRKLSAQSLGRLGDMRAVEPLIAALGDSDAEVIVHAAESLGELKDIRAIEPLLIVLENIDPQWGNILSAAAAALGKLGDPRAVEPLIKKLEDKQTRVRMAAAQALDMLKWRPADGTVKAKYLIAKGEYNECAALGPAGIETLAAQLEDKDPYTRNKVAIILGRYGDARAVKELVSLLKDKEIYTRKETVEALANINDPAVFGHITEALKDPSGTVREAAVLSLKKAGGVKAVEHLILAVRDIDPNVRISVADALAELNDPAAVIPLMAMLLIDTEPKSRKAFIIALFKLNDLRAAEVLVNALFQNPEFTKNELSGSFEYMKNIFGGYAGLIFDAACSHYDFHIVNQKDRHGDYQYDLTKNNAAIEALCKLRTTISSNILHKVAQKNDIEIKIGYSCIYAVTGKLSFEVQREMAKNELQIRGNPPYDRGAFLEKRLWRL